MSLEAADAAAAAVSTGAPRVTLADMVAAIAARIDTTGDQARPPAGTTFFAPTPSDPKISLDEIRGSLERLSICILVMRNGFTVIGKSAPASPENFNAEFGKKLAYEDAVKQLWPLMGFALRDRLATQQTS